MDSDLFVAHTVVPNVTHTVVPTVPPIVVPTVAVSKGNQQYVSPSFKLLQLPVVERKKCANARQKIPKALSGTAAIALLEEKENRKRQEEEAKRLRKEERERKRKQREIEKVKKQNEREAKRKQKEEEKKIKEIMKSVKQKRRRPSGSSSSSGDATPTMDDSDDEVDETLICPGCKTDVDASDDCVRCTKCPSRWHVTCTGDALLMEIPHEQIHVYPYVCEECMDV